MSSSKGTMWYLFDPTPSASNWLERLPAGSISTWEDLTTRFLAQFFSPVRTAKLRNDILINRNAKESWALLKDLALYDNESWNDPRDFTKPVKAISLPQDVPSTSDRRLIELENQVQCLMESHLAPRQPTQVNKIISLCESMRSPATQMNFTSTNYPTKEELRGKGIKSASKLLSLKYLSQSSLAEQNRNPSSLKRIHFVNSIVILNKEDEAKEEGNVKSSTTEYEDHEMNVESEEEFEGTKTKKE
ncbi:MAK10-like protein [Tanacetum coccineum]